MNGKTEYWGNSYGYDAWGNLTAKTVTKCSAENLSLTALVNNQLSGYGYDAAGNMTTDGTDGITAVYDAENRIASASKSGVTTSYVYDADGNRVEKTGGGTGTLYWYMTPGIVAESDLAGNLQSEYVFFNGERVARRDFNPSTGAATGVFYYFSDHLKTVSVITDAAGTPKAESDYYPWGGELQFVNNDSNHYKFTGKERDTESGLDYFGARCYSNGLGRFITPDWAEKATAVPYAEFSDPQSLNLYTYVRNIPTSNADADGHEPVIDTDERGRRYVFGQKVTWQPSRLDLLFGSIPKEIDRELTDLLNLGNRIGCKLDSQCTVPDQETLPEPDSPEEAKMMSLISYALLFLPGEGEAKAGTEAEKIVTHHGLPRQKQLRAVFDALGIDIEKYTIRMGERQHRRIHTVKGGDWNKAWKKFLEDPKNRTIPHIEQQLEKMIRDFGIIRREPL